MPAPIAEATNACSDMACPKCKSQAGFTIDVISTATLTDDGIYDLRDSDWEPGANTTCQACSFFATAEEFEVNPGDVLLNNDEVAALLDCAGEALAMSGQASSVLDTKARALHVTEVGPAGSTTTTLTYPQIRRAFNDALAAGRMPAFMLREIEHNDMCFDGDVGFITLQYALYGEIRYA